ncbi:helix-turn-helix domain-containing protein [Streptomyces sp. NPDC002285]
MGTRTRLSLSPVELERRRLQAADLFEQGMQPVRVAEALGVTRQAARVPIKLSIMRSGGG